MLVLYLLLGLAAPAQDWTIAERLFAVPVADSVRLIDSYGRLPLSFEANRGQTHPQVKFLSRGRGYTLFLTDDEAVLALRSRQSSVVSSQLQQTGDYGRRTTNRLLPSSIDNLQSTIVNSPAVLRLKLLGANPSAKASGLDELPGKNNYLLGNDPKKWRTNVPNYTKVKYQNVYPGIDLIYYGDQSHLEFDFVVAPGADPKAIRLELYGLVGAARRVAQNGRGSASPLQIDSTGDLLIQTDDGEVRFHKPVVYQLADSRRSSVVSSQLRPATDNGPLTTDAAKAGNRQSSIDNRQYLDGRYVLRPAKLQNRNSKITNRQSSINNSSSASKSPPTTPPGRSSSTRS